MKTIIASNYQLWDTHVYLQLIHVHCLLYAESRMQGSSASYRANMQRMLGILNALH